MIKSTSQVFAQHFPDTITFNGVSNPKLNFRTSFPAGLPFTCDPVCLGRGWLLKPCAKLSKSCPLASSLWFLTRLWLHDACLALALAHSHGSAYTLLSFSGMTVWRSETQLPELFFFLFFACLLFCHQIALGAVMLLIKLRSEVLKMHNSQASWLMPETGKVCSSLLEA